MRNDDRLIRTARAHGWKADRTPRDEYGNVLLTFTRGRERVTTTVFFSPIHRGIGQVLATHDEHSALAGSAATFDRLRAACPFCPTPKENR